MGNFDKLLTTNADVLFFILIVETIIIIILILHIIYRKWFPIEEKVNENGTSISDIIKKKDDTIAYWRDAFIKSQGEQSPQVKSFRGRDRMTNLNRTDDSINDYTEYAKREREKGIYVDASSYGDETSNNEILFDLSNDSPTPVSTPISRKYEYLESASNGQFRKLLSSDEKSFFRTWEENGVRKFEFHKNVDRALANINAIFDDVCEIEGKQNGATQIINIEPGILSSQLKVEKMAKIKLI